MYLKYYGLKKEPFHITPDPDFLFLSPSHKEALASIVYGIENKKGFIEIVGAVGVGKTTILRSYLERIDRGRMKTIYVFNANVSFGSLLKTIYQELGLVADTDDSFLLVNRLQQVLIDEYEQGHNVVLIVDEAQNMPVETMENLRMLSNLETATEKLIQIVMIGQTEFDDLLARNELRQLRQRIAIRTVIFPLTPVESVQYIKHRLSKVTDNGQLVLTDDAMNEIVRAARGIPRVINILCDNALITGYGYQKKPVNARIVREILRDFENPPKQKSFPWSFATAAVLLILAVVFFWVSPYRTTVFQLFAGPTVKIAADQTKTSLPVVIPESRATPPPLAQTPPKLEAQVALPKEPVAKTGTRETAARDSRKSLDQGRANAYVSKDRRSSPRIVERGDTLSKLIRDKYGTYDSDMLSWIRQSNPHITNPNRIMIGDEIFLPDERRQPEIRAQMMGKAK